MENTNALMDVATQWYTVANVFEQAIESANVFLVDTLMQHPKIKS